MTRQPGTRITELPAGTSVAFERDGRHLRGTVVANLPGRDHDVDCAIIEIEHQLPGIIYAIPLAELEVATDSTHPRRSS